MRKKSEIKSINAKKHWAGLTPEEKAALLEKIKEGMRRYWARLSQEEKLEIGRTISKAKREKASAKKS